MSRIAHPHAGYFFKLPQQLKNTQKLPFNIEINLITTNAYDFPADPYGLLKALKQSRIHLHNANSKQIELTLTGIRLAQAKHSANQADSTESLD